MAEEFKSLQQPVAFEMGSKLGDGELQDGAGEGLHDDTSLIFDAGEFHMFHGIYQDFIGFQDISWNRLKFVF